jgi:hypothetical protein
MFLAFKINNNLKEHITDEIDYEENNNEESVTP